MDKNEFHVLIKYCFLKGKNTVEAKTWLDAEFPKTAPGKSAIKDCVDVAPPADQSVSPSMPPSGAKYGVVFGRQKRRWRLPGGGRYGAPLRPLFVSLAPGGLTDLQPPFLMMFFD
ncbi:hypothetical protein GWI33_006139 [Rhynchophorus ferrugineus]|uniref:Mos1 transposase HTH domain-containing protein n=1 Tax=Rhynchophorus ferrugineus TaxID=354439 RepID=A0A834IFJ4_RHYFE|nr:hypothetical protein GWI33_006139 [Rhynchophorus ferrugineus]